MNLVYKTTYDVVRVFLLNQRSHNTSVAYGRDISELLSIAQEQNLEAIHKVHLLAFRHTIERKYKTATVARKLASVRSFFQFCVNEGIIDTNPCIGIKGPRLPLEGKTLEFTDEEVRNLLAVCPVTTVKGVRDRTILEFLFHLGLRVSELTAIKAGDLQRDGDTPVLRVHGKGGKDRVIPLQPRLIRWAIRYVEKCPVFHFESHLFRPVQNTFDGDLDKPLSARSVWVIVKQYAEKAGITKRVSPHSGRVTATGNALDHNCGLIETSDLMGWSSVKMVQKYDRRRKKLIKSAAYSISYEREKRDGEQRDRTG